MRAVPTLERQLARREERDARDEGDLRAMQEELEWMLRERGADRGPGMRARLLALLRQAVAGMK